MPEAEPLSQRKTALVLLIVGGCFAVLWPRLLQPALLGRNQYDPLAPNTADRAQGCCDVIFETDVNAIKIMTELCGNILERKKGPLDARTASAFASGKLPADIIATCRLEVNSTCGVDISTFLQQNVKLGKTYKQILEEVRSYNSSACLKMHFGVPTWELGTGHVIGKTWSEQDLDKDIKQERPPHMRSRSTPHPAMRERGRAIPVDSVRPTPPSRVLPEVTERREGRVRSPLSVYYETTAEPPPIPGMRPPLGGAGGVLPPPKSSVGFVMPVYTICIVMFFLYTLMKILFKRTDTSGNYDPVTPDPIFRSRVFEERLSSRASPDAKIVTSAISGLVAEVRQQMEATYAQSNGANSTQDLEDTTHSYTNGTVRGARDASPVRIVVKEYKEATPEPSTERKEKTPDPREQHELNDVKETTQPKEKAPETIERTPKLEEEIEEEITHEKQPPEEKQSTPELLADAIKEDSPQKENGLDFDKEDGLNEEMSEEEIEYEIEEEEEESPLVRQLRASVEKDKATVKHEAAEVSSIFLEGDIPQQSRLLVADSATRTDRDTGGKDTPIVLSGKMTLSLINDEARLTPDKDLESTTLDDDDFTTASAVTQPKQNTQQEEELSEEEIEEEVEEEMEVEEFEVEEDDDAPIQCVFKETIKNVQTESAESIDAAPAETFKTTLLESVEAVPTESYDAETKDNAASEESVKTAAMKPIKAVESFEASLRKSIEIAASEPKESSLSEHVEGMLEETIDVTSIKASEEESVEPTETALKDSINPDHEDPVDEFPVESCNRTVIEIPRPLSPEPIEAIPRYAVTEDTVKTAPMKPIKAIESFEGTLRKSIEIAAAEPKESALSEHVEEKMEEPIEVTSINAGEELSLESTETVLTDSLNPCHVDPVDKFPVKSCNRTLIEVLRPISPEPIEAIPIEPEAVEHVDTISMEQRETILKETLDAQSEESVKAIPVEIASEGIESETFATELDETELSQHTGPEFEEITETGPFENIEEVSTQLVDEVLKKCLEAVEPFDTDFEEILKASTEEIEPTESIEAISKEIEAVLHDSPLDAVTPIDQEIRGIVEAEAEVIKEVPIETLEEVSKKFVKGVLKESLDAELKQIGKAVSQEIVESVPIKPVETAMIESFESVSMEQVDAPLEENIESQRPVEAILIEPVEAVPIEPIEVATEETIDISDK